MGLAAVTGGPNKHTHVQLVGHGLKVDGGGRDPLGVGHVAMGEAAGMEMVHIMHHDRTVPNSRSTIRNRVETWMFKGRKHTNK